MYESTVHTNWCTIISNFKCKLFFLNPKFDSFLKAESAKITDYVMTENTFPI